MPLLQLLRPLVRAARSIDSLLATGSLENARVAAESSRRRRKVFSVLKNRSDALLKDYVA